MHCYQKLPRYKRWVPGGESILCVLDISNSLPFPAGEQSSDLPFECGEVLTIIEPCNVIYWYLAENSMGRRGVIPITYVQVSMGKNMLLRHGGPPTMEVGLFFSFHCAMFANSTLLEVLLCNYIPVLSLLTFLKRKI